MKTANNKIEILIIDNDQNFVRNIKECLNLEIFDILHKDSIESVIIDKNLRYVDCILLGLYLPYSKGTDTIQIIKKYFPEIPIIVLTNLDDEIAINMLREGAQDYLAKSKINGEILFRSIRYAIERVKIENSLRKSEKKYKNIIETIIEGLWIIDKEGRTVFINQRLIKILGYQQTELLSIPFFNFVYEKDKEKSKEHFKRRKEGITEKYQLRFQKKDGTVIWALVSSSPIFDNEGNFDGATGLITDITRHRIVEDKLVESEELYRTIIEYSNDMIWSLNTEGYFTFFNREAEKLSGYKLEDCKDKSFFSLVAEKDLNNVVDEFKTSLMRQSKYDFTLITKLKKPINISVNTSPIYSKGKVVGTVSIGRDITDQIKSEQQLKKLTDELIRSNRELEQFAYITSHDLQEPLRSISSFAELLSRNYRNQLSSEADEFIDYIITGTKRMQEMINDLLALSRIGTKGKEFLPTDISKAIKNAINSLHTLIEKSNANIVVDKMPIINVDESQFIQLFQNLIENAIKFRKENAEPQIIISSKEDKEKNEWIFSVRDNGIGINQKDFDKLFVIFQRLHSRETYPGTGIGLAICKKIVTRHEGRIWVESTLGEGSTFYFSIPNEKKYTSIINKYRKLEADYQYRSKSFKEFMSKDKISI